MIPTFFGLNSITLTIHPANRTIAGPNSGLDFYDEEAREPIQDVPRESTVTINAQLTFFKKEDVKKEEKGVSLRTSGHVAFRMIDLKAIGYVPKYGDKVVKLTQKDGTSYDVAIYFVSNGKLSGYYHRDGFTLMLIDITDKEPREDG